MASHVWDREVAQWRAADMKAVYHLALDAGVPVEAARLLAVYVVEVQAQRGIRFPVGDSIDDPQATNSGAMIKRVMRSGYRFARGKNAGNYAKCWMNHLPWMVMEFAEAARLPTDTPVGVIADKLEEEGHPRSGELRDMIIPTY